jgi:hypothetical protein
VGPINTTVKVNSRKNVITHWKESFSSCRIQIKSMMNRRTDSVIPSYPHRLSLNLLISIIIHAW